MSGCKPGRTFGETFQQRVVNWMRSCFRKEVIEDSVERNMRFLEEAFELVQARGMTQTQAYSLMLYVFKRPVGEQKQEVGGVLVTLAALCAAARIDMQDCGEKELARCWDKIDEIRGKQDRKPRSIKGEY